MPEISQEEFDRFKKDYEDLRNEVIRLRKLSKGSHRSQEELNTLLYKTKIKWMKEADELGIKFGSVMLFPIKRK